MIRDLFIEGCDQLRDKLLMTEQLTLSSLEATAEATDRGLQRRVVLREICPAAAAEEAPVVEVAYTKEKPAKVGRGARDGSRKCSGICHACGFECHWARDSQCTARDKRCNKCHDVGH